MKRSIVMIITALIISATIIPTPSFASEVKVDLAENAKSAILIERDTGTVLFEKIAMKDCHLQV